MLASFDFIRPRYHLVFGLTLALLSGCESTSNIADQGAWQKAQASVDASIVFGRIIWIENGEEKHNGSSVFEWSIAPRLLRLDDRTTINGEFDSDGRL